MRAREEEHLWQGLAVGLGTPFALECFLIPKHWTEEETKGLTVSWLFLIRYAGIQTSFSKFSDNLTKVWTSENLNTKNSLEDLCTTKRT
ncbi:hypothetical protein SUGI_0843280 [Cryptomeria japonica]|nr:hypothetical protein SUGI_0843280 [Cryptomeria japonica]